MKCDNCGKGRMVGRSHRHHPGVAGGRWKKRAPKTQKIFKPNLHVARVTINGVSKRMKLCTKCLRLIRLAESKRVEEQDKIAQESVVNIATNGKITGTAI